MKFWVTSSGGNGIQACSPLGHYFKFSQGQQQPNLVITLWLSDLCEISWGSPLCLYWTLTHIKKAPLQLMQMLPALTVMKGLHGCASCMALWTEEEVIFLGQDWYMLGETSSSCTFALPVQVCEQPKASTLCKQEIKKTQTNAENIFCLKANALYDYTGDSILVFFFFNYSPTSSA